MQPSSGSLNGTIQLDIHYYEDGNVRMSTSKKLNLSVGSGSADDIVREVAKAENKFQEELNRSFTALAEGSFKSLRRQLPVTRQRVEWEKIGGYRVSPSPKRCADREPHVDHILVGSRYWRWPLQMISPPSVGQVGPCAHQTATIQLCHQLSKSSFQIFRLFILS